MNTPPSNPIFLVGFFRSGTSLLYSLLNQHPQVALMYECDVWDFPRLFSKLRFRRNWLERLEFYSRPLSRHRLAFGGTLRGLENVGTPEDLYRCFGDVKGAAFWGEKSPLYCARLLQLARRHPGCSFILIWRDPIEVYRSVLEAGRKEPYFRRRGMLNRLIYHQEQMIRQAARLGRAGARIHYVTYDDMVDKTEEVCRGICRFLGTEFDRKMLDLTDADLSAVHRAPHHDHLRSGVIQRRQFAENSIEAPVLEKLRRFRVRWKRLQSQWFVVQDDSLLGLEPGLAERAYHRVAGSLFHLAHDAKRALLEFLPLPWLRTYRQVKEWFAARRAEAPSRRLSLRQEFAAHRITILAACAILTSVAALQSYSDPRMVFMPFYMIPCALLTLVVSRRWGIFVAVISAIVGPVLQSLGDPDFAQNSVLLWNSTMRYVVFQTVILLLDRVRLEMASASTRET